MVTGSYENPRLYGVDYEKGANIVQSGIKSAMDSLASIEMQKQEDLNELYEDYASFQDGTRLEPIANFSNEINDALRKSVGFRNNVIDPRINNINFIRDLSKGENLRVIPSKGEVGFSVEHTSTGEIYDASKLAMLAVNVKDVESNLNSVDTEISSLVLLLICFQFQTKETRLYGLLLMFQIAMALKVGI